MDKVAFLLTWGLVITVCIFVWAIVIFCMFLPYIGIPLVILVFSGIFAFFFVILTMDKKI